MTARVTKVVFDTNILVSGHFWKGPPYRRLLAVDAGFVLLVLSEPIISEFKEKLERKFGVPTSKCTPSSSGSRRVRRLSPSKDVRVG